MLISTQIWEKQQKMVLKNTFLSWWIMQCFWKTTENVRKHKDIKLVTAERRRNYLVSEPNYHTTKVFKENLLATEMRKTGICINKQCI